MKTALSPLATKYFARLNEEKREKEESQDDNDDGNDDDDDDEYEGSDKLMPLGLFKNTFSIYFYFYHSIYIF